MQPGSLTQKDLTAKREEIERLIADLREQADASRDAAKTVELDQTAVGRLSRMDSMQSQAMVQAARRALEMRINHCHAALQAIERGEYGLCRNCEEPIDVKRLAVKPEAPLCLACQRGADRPDGGR